MSSCARHSFVRAVARCERCDDRLCAECHVEAKGHTYCIDCAMFAAGVRSSGRSGKGAVAIRKRVNGEPAPAPAVPSVIDLRDERRTPAPSLRPSWAGGPDRSEHLADDAGRAPVHRRPPADPS